MVLELYCGLVADLLALGIGDVEACVTGFEEGDGGILDKGREVVVGLGVWVELERVQVGVERRHTILKGDANLGVVKGMLSNKGKVTFLCDVLVLSSTNKTRLTKRELGPLSDSGSRTTRGLSIPISLPLSIVRPHESSGAHSVTKGLRECGCSCQEPKGQDGG